MPRNMEGIYDYKKVVDFCKSFCLGLRTFQRGYREQYYNKHDHTAWTIQRQPDQVIIYIENNSLQDLETLKELAETEGFKLFNVVNIPLRNNDWNKTVVGLELLTWN